MRNILKFLGAGMLGIVGGSQAAASSFEFEATALPPLYDTRSAEHTDFGRAAAIADFNGDELPDIYIGHGTGQNDVVLYQHASERWRVRNLDSRDTEASFAALAVDLNRDFAPDLLVARQSGTWIYLNQGGLLQRSGKLPAPTRRIGSGITRALVAADLDGDGWIDVFETRADGEAGDGDRLWINAGELDHGRPVFREEATRRGADLCCNSAGAVIHDIEGDGDQDIVVASRGDSLSLLVNDGDGNFAIRGIPIAPGDWKSVVAGDIDNDEDIDFLIAGAANEAAGSSVRLLEYDAGVFNDVTLSRGIRVMAPVHSAVLVDNDMDGLLDISIASDHSDGLLAKTPPRYLRGAGKGREFQDVTGDVSLGTRSHVQMLVTDINRDGRPDQLVLANGAKDELLVNRKQRANWLGVILRGRNDGAVAGTRVRLRMQDGTRLTRYFRHGESLGMDGEDTLLVGVGRRNAITVLEVYWPSGKHTRIDGSDLNRHIGLLEPSDRNRNDVSLKYPILGLVEAQNKLMREDPSLRDKMIQPKARFICR